MKLKIECLRKELSAVDHLMWVWGASLGGWELKREFVFSHYQVVLLSAVLSAGIWNPCHKKGVPLESLI